MNCYHIFTKTTYIKYCKNAMKILKYEAANDKLVYREMVFIFAVFFIHFANKLI